MVNLIIFSNGSNLDMLWVLVRNVYGFVKVLETFFLGFATGGLAEVQNGYSPGNVVRLTGIIWHSQICRILFLSEEAEI